MTTRIALTGSPVPNPEPDEFGRLYGEEAGYRVVREVRTGGTRAGVDDVVLEAEPDDIIEITDADGFVTFRRVSAVVAAAPGAGARSEDTAVALRTVATRDGLGPVESVRQIRLSLPPDVAAAVSSLGDADESRGVAEQVLDLAAKPAMATIVAWVDKPCAAGDPSWHDKPKPRGLYRLGSDLRLDPGGLLAEGELTSTEDPWLLLLHGTFSHTEGAFGGLRGGDFTSFARTYGPRILGLEHATLGMTPAQNALDAVRALPAGARLHLVSHSRGGLVGDALSRAGAAQWPDTDLYVRWGVSDHPDVAALSELRTLARAKNIRVERFARVACPGRGTTLASRRLDAFAKYLFHVLWAVPALRETGAAALIEKFLLTLLDKRSDPRLVPGLEAMMPESPFVKWLNTGPGVDDGMASISGDVEGSGIVKRLAVMAADLFYRGDHDFVVNTSAMSGGVPRATRREAFFRGPSVTHSSYFRRPDTRRAVLGWLAASSLDVPAFAEPGGPPTVSRAPAAPRDIAGTVLLVPDAFGSVLTYRRKVVWPSVAALSAGVAEALSPSRNYTPAGLTGAYDALVGALSSRYAVQALDYDWTRPASESATALRRGLESALDDADGSPVHVVAVGAGGLHLLAALGGGRGSRAGDDLAARIAASKGRLVLLSPPLAGSWQMAATLRGEDELTARLTLLDPQRSARDVGAALAALPGLTELLPDGAPFPRDVLDAAHALRDGLPAAAPPPTSVVYGSRTASVAGWDADHFTTVPGGDGHVVAPATPLPGAVAGWAPLSFADLLGTPAGTSHVLNLLRTGASPGLLASAPAGVGGEGRLTTLEGRVDFPSDADLALAPVGIPAVATPPRVRAIRLSVTHGDITFVDAPILVGTYDGTPIRGAERALDQRFGGALSARAAVGQLAGPLGTSDIITRPRGPGAAVVIGMGDPGELTPGQLTANVTQALLRLVLRMRDNGRLAEGEGLTVASVLIGTSGSGTLSVQPSLSAIVRGVHHTNRHLMDVREKVGDVWIEALQVVELYEDRAIEAAQAAIRLAGERQPEGAAIAVERFLLEGCDGKPGLPPPDYSSGLWRTIRVVAADAGEHGGPPADEHVALSFTSIGRAARAEQRVNRAQRRIVDHLVDEGIDRPQADPQLYNTLYELILPTSMKGQGPATDNLMFVVDAAASTIPYELLATRGSDETPLPLAVETGLLRRLETTSFRESVRPAAGARALVIGDPAGVRPRLPGARREARRVAAKLAERGFQVTALISESDDDESVTVTRIMNALFRYDYRIIHVAAHGTYESDHVNGILIGHDTLLTAHEVRQMRATPDLVFLNACHVGSVVLRRSAGSTGAGTGAGATGAAGTAPTNAAGRMAASLARQLIDDGVRAVVAAGWAVDDSAAAAFAERFYDDLLGAYDLGDAVRQARAEIYRAYPDVNTWGAYQVYGPPAMRIHVAQASLQEDRAVISRKQYRDGLRALRTRADSATDAERASVVGALRQHLESVPDRWHGGPELDAEAAVWFSLGEYELAIERYHDALRAWEGRAPLSLVEQLINATVKRAAQLDDDPDRQAALYAEAETLVEALRSLRGETPERLAIQGSYLRRRATAGPEPDWSMLARAAEAYEKALELHRERTGRVGFYYGLNWATLAWLVAVHAGAEADLTRLASTIEGAVEDAAAQECANFWCRAASTDAGLTRALVAGTLARERRAVVGGYHEVFADGSSRRERLAIAEHLEIIERCLPDGDAQRQALADIRADIAGWRDGASL